VLHSKGSNQRLKQRWSIQKIIPTERLKTVCPA
jgi:hypothetical protein